MDHLVPTLVPGSQVLRLDDTVVIRTWHRTLRLRGAAAQLTARVLEAVDGKARTADLAAQLDMDGGLVEKILAKLRDGGIVLLSEDGPAPLSRRDTLDLASGTAAAHGLPDPTQGQRVLVVGHGSAAKLVADRLGELCAGTVAHVGSPDELPADGDLGAGIVYAEELMTYHDALAVDSRAAAAGVAWCAGWWEGAQLVVTHEMRFGRSACFECLLERQRANYAQPEVDILLEERLRTGAMTTAGPDRTQPVPALLSSLLADLLVLRALSLLSGSTRTVQGRRLAEFSLVNWDLRWSTVLRLPSCRRCSPGVLRPARALA
jgi:hypothetical protein